MHPASFSRLNFSAALLSIVLILCAATLSAGEPEVLKGTVKSLEPTLLVLKDSNLKDDSLSRKDVKIICDRETAYFYGGTKVPREEIAPGYLVLVKCEQAGSDRKALSVRVIKGK